MASKVIPLMEGERIILREQLPSDVDRFVYWLTHGEWRKFDAPWEDASANLFAEGEERFRAKFLHRCQEEKPTPRKSAVIILKKNDCPLGWVNTYVKKGFQDLIYVGIDICEDDALGCGLGTEALRLWLDYLFENSTFHKIGLETWSFNPRMMRVAEKVGFCLEGMLRENLQWQGQWLDMINYGILRREWEDTKEF